MTKSDFARVLEGIRRSFGEVSRPKLLAVLVTVTVCVIVLPSGPSMEEIFAAIANPKRESIYANTFGEFLVNKDEIFVYWPSFKNYMAVSLLSVLFSLKARGKSQFFVSVWLWVALCITLMDVGYANIYKSEINITFSALSNIIGGGIVAAICAFIFLICDGLRFRYDRFGFAISMAIAAISAFSLVAAIYVLYGIFFYTPSSYFKAEVSNPRAFFSSATDLDKAKAPFFGFTPSRASITRFEGAHKGPVVIKMKSLDPNPPLDLEIFVLRDCGLGWLGEWASGTPMATYQQVRSVSVQSDAPSDIRFRFSKPAMVDIPGSRRLMSWAPNAERELLAYPYRSFNRSRIRLLPDSSYVGQFSTSVIDVDEKKVLNRKERSIKIEIDKIITEIKLVPTEIFEEKADNSCHLVNSKNIVGNIAVSVVIKASASQNPLYIGDDGREVDVDVGVGDFWLYTEKSSESAIGHEGESKDIQIWGGLRKLIFGGKSIDIQNSEELLTVMGNVKVSSNEAGIFTIDGVADYAYLGDVRLNQTRWEMIGDEWRVWLIGGVCAALLAIVRFAWSYMNPRLRGDFDAVGP